MRIHCNIIQDLLPLYQDNVCSMESRELVEQHLKTCEECRKELASIDIELSNSHLYPEDEKIVSAASAAWKKSKRIAFIKAIAITLAVVFLFFALFIYPYTKAGMFLTVKTWERQMTAVAQEQLLKQAGNEKAYWGYRVKAFPESDCVFFEYVGARYTGFVYSAEDIPVGFQGTDAKFERHGDGWLWKEASGDNWMYTERIADHWYWYEMHF